MIITSHIKLITKMKVRNLLLAGLAVAAMTVATKMTKSLITVKYKVQKTL